MPSRTLKYFLTLFLPSVIVLLLAVSGGIAWDVKMKLAVLQERELNQAELAASTIAHDFEPVTSDLLLLSHEMAFLEYLDSRTPARQKEVENLFLNLSKAKGLYDQVRFLDSAGMEIIRVDYRNGTPAVIPARELQDKSGRYFFRDSIKLNRNDIFVSPLDLNIEHNQIELPYKPMIRFGTPVFDRSGKKQGVLLLNYFGSKLLDHFKKIGQHYPQVQMMLLNRDGFWLSSSITEDEWGFMFKNDHSFANRFPGEWKIIATDERGTLLTGNGMFTFVTTYPLLPKHLSSTGTPQPIGSSEKQLHPNDYYWKTVSQVPVAQLPAAKASQYPVTTILFGVSFVLLGLGSAFLAHFSASREQTRQHMAESQARLQEITATLGEGVYVIDQVGTITYVNPEAEKVLGWLHDELMGHDAHELFHYKRADGTFCSKDNCEIGKVVNTGKTYRSESELFWRKDGTSFAVAVCSTPIIRKGNIVGSVVAFTDISVRKKNEQALREAEERLRLTFESAAIGMALASPDQHFIEANPAMAWMLGYKPEELLDKTLQDVTYPGDWECDRDYIRQLLNGERLGYHIEKRLVHKNGKTIWTQMSVSVMVDVKTHQLNYVLQAQDISERKAAETALRRSKEVFQATLSSIGESIYLLDRNGHLINVNPTGAKRLGAEPEALIGQDVFSYLPLEVAERRRAIVGETFRSMRPRTFEDSRNDRIYLSSYYPVLDSEGQCEAIVVVASDITERKQAENQLREAALYARSLIEASLDPLVTISADGKITDVNRSTEEVTGYSRDELKGTDFSAYFTEPEKAREGYQQVFSNGFVKDFPLSICHREGRITEVLYNATVYRDTSGRVSGVFAAARDITDRKQAEDRLIEASLYARSLIEASLDPLVTISVDGKITDVNYSTEQVTGYSRDELIGTDFSAYFTEPEKARAGYRQVFSDGFVKDYPLSIRHRGGNVTDVLYNASVYRDASGEVSGVFAAARDITERRRMEEQLRELNTTLDRRVKDEVSKNMEQERMLIQQSRLAAMGEMIGNIAHQWRQPLNALGLLIANIKDAYDYNELDERTLEDAVIKGRQYIEKMSTTIDDFRNFFKPNKIRETFSLEETINNSLNLLSSSLKNNNISVQIGRATEAKVNGFPNEFSQVLLNILNNAKDALIENHIANGAIDVSLGNDEQSVWIVIKDNAGGIPEENLPKIFDPYFTTKEKGTGIGLYMSKVIIENHMDGKIEARNIEGGAEFKVLLPKQG